MYVCVLIIDNVIITNAVKEGSSARVTLPRILIKKTISKHFQGRILVGAMYFAILLNLKHIYLYVVPAYVVWLVKRYCLRDDRFFTRFFALGSTVLFVLAISFFPFATQLLQVTKISAFDSKYVHSSNRHILIIALYFRPGNFSALSIQARLGSRILGCKFLGVVYRSRQNIVCNLEAFRLAIKRSSSIDDWWFGAGKFIRYITNSHSTRYIFINVHIDTGTIILITEKWQHRSS